MSTAPDPAHHPTRRPAGPAAGAARALRGRRRRAVRGVVAATLAALVLGLAACGGGGDGGGNGGANGGGSAKDASCPVDALDRAQGPVDIVMWHAMARANEDELKRLTSEFNASQDKVRVKLINQTSYKDAFTKYKAGLSSGDLPDLVQLEDTTPQQMIDTGSVVPVEACAKADGYEMDDFVPAVLARYRVKGELWPMPFNVSNPVFYFDQDAFRKAGLDPEKPPATLEDVKAAAEAVKTKLGYKAGYGLKLDPWYLEQWMAKADQLYVNNGNGRDGRATAVEFDSPTGEKTFAWMSDMVHSGLALTNSADGGAAYNNLLGIGSKQVAMTVDTSAALGTISQILGSGQYPGVELGVAPMPGPSTKGGVLVGGGVLYISKRSSAAKQAAAWEFAKFLVTPENQAAWAAATGYVPIRKSAAKLPAIQKQWAENPGYKVAYDQLVETPVTPATQGPVIGDYQGVRDAVLAGMQEMFTQDVPPARALANAAKAADAAMAAYNQRVGG